MKVVDRLVEHVLASAPLEVRELPARRPRLARKRVPQQATAGAVNVLGLQREVDSVVLPEVRYDVLAVLKPVEDEAG